MFLQPKKKTKPKRAAAPVVVIAEEKQATHDASTTTPPQPLTRSLSVNDKAATNNNSSNGVDVSTLCQNCKAVIKGIRDKTVVQLSSLIALRWSIAVVNADNNNNPNDNTNKEAKRSSSADATSAKTASSSSSRQQLTGDGLMTLLDGVMIGMNAHDIRERAHDDAFMDTPSRLCNRCFEAMLECDIDAATPIITAALNDLR
jgi:hypothetical protein